jgi:hypothetical protein
MSHSIAHDYGHRQEYHGEGYQYRDHQDCVKSLASALFSQKKPSHSGLAPPSTRRLARKCDAVKGIHVAIAFSRPKTCQLPGRLPRALLGSKRDIPAV